VKRQRYSDQLLVISCQLGGGQRKIVESRNQRTEN
jgi:hypothetical protein